MIYKLVFKNALDPILANLILEDTIFLITVTIGRETVAFEYWIF